MIYLNRILKSIIQKKIQANKVIIITGARRVGKTILLQQLIKEFKEPYLLLNGEDFTTLDLLAHRSIVYYKNILQTKKILIIDEAQKIPDIGKILKLIVDNIEGIKIVVTGSSAFDIYNITGEPLTGRKYSYSLFPFSENELSQIEDQIHQKENLKLRLIYGNYPESTQINNLDDKSEYLKEIINSYLLKDILLFENIKNSRKILNLLRLIAYQTGNEVSLQELGIQLSMSKNTVEKYLDLLTKVYILYCLQGFSKNLRKEVTKSTKWYFYDNGIRNAIIANFNLLEQRNDIGQLWENYIISERIKYQHYNRMIVNNYFWRTYDQQEIDWVEEREGKLYGYEMKWKTTKTKIPAAWEKNYSNASYQLITPDNFYNWLNKKAK